MVVARGMRACRTRPRQRMSHTGSREARWGDAATAQPCLSTPAPCAGRRQAEQETAAWAFPRAAVGDGLVTHLACKEKPWALAQRGPVSAGASPAWPKPAPRRRTRSPARASHAPVRRGATDGAGRKGHTLARAPAGAGWHGMGGHRRWKRLFESLILHSSVLAHLVDAAGQIPPPQHQHCQAQRRATCPR
jgi:hypothetical protein